MPEPPPVAMPPSVAGPRPAGALAAMTCYFNPCGYAAPRRNYRRFAEGLRGQGVPLYTIELAFGDAPFFLAPDGSVTQVRSADVLWQKERLLNLLLPAVPVAFDKIAWVDADLQFTNPGWASEAARRLERCPVVQLFEHCVQLDGAGRPGEACNGVALAVARGLDDARHLGRSHPGYAWAARRPLLERHGLLDFEVIGGGDTLMVFAMFGWWDHPGLGRYSRGMRAAFSAWADPFWRDVRGGVGYVPGRVFHMWHGRREDRKYDVRVDWMRQHDFDPRTDLAPGEGGLWRWGSGKRAMHEQVRRYFSERREDG